MIRKNLSAKPLSNGKNNNIHIENRRQIFLPSVFFAHMYFFAEMDFVLLHAELIFAICTFERVSPHTEQMIIILPSVFVPAGVHFCTPWCPDAAVSSVQ